MRWLCGLDLSPDNLGPLEVAGWLHDHGHAEIHALTVVRQPPQGFDEATRTELYAELQDLGRRKIHASTATDAIHAHHVTLGHSVEATLCERAVALGAGLIVGRLAERDDDTLPRLGKIARRVLRWLPGPTCVVPPDVRRDDLERGPIVIGIEPRAEALPALRFGRALSEATGRPARLVHVVDPFDFGLGRTFAARAHPQRRADHDAATERMRAYLVRHDVHDLPCEVVIGQTTDALLGVAETENACALVTGSRRLSLSARIFSGSVASQLASAATVPIFVVPAPVLPGFG